MFSRIICYGAILFLGASCSNTPYRPISPLITHPLDAKKAHDSFTGIWHQPVSAKSKPKQKRTEYIYVAPVDIEAIRQQFPKTAPYLAREFRDSLQKEVQIVIQSRNAKAGNASLWKLSDRPAPRACKYPWRSCA